MRRIRFIGQPERAFPRLPFAAQVAAAERLRAIATGPNEHVSGTLKVEDGTQLRYFRLMLPGLEFRFRFTYTVTAKDLWVFKVAAFRNRR